MKHIWAQSLGQVSYAASLDYPMLRRNRTVLRTSSFQGSDDEFVMVFLRAPKYYDISRIYSKALF